MKFKVGDLVTLSDKCTASKKHTANQCKMGIILSQEEFKEELLYKVHWWSFNQTFYFVHSDLRLISRICVQKTGKFGTILNDIDDFEEK